jgi:hypothetical protein
MGGAEPVSGGWVAGAVTGGGLRVGACALLAVATGCGRGWAGRFGAGSRVGEAGRLTAMGGDLATTCGRGCCGQLKAGCCLGASGTFRGGTGCFSGGVLRRQDFPCRSSRCRCGGTCCRACEYSPQINLL